MGCFPTSSSGFATRPARRPWVASGDVVAPRTGCTLASRRRRCESRNGSFRRGTSTTMEGYSQMHPCYPLDRRSSARRRRLCRGRRARSRSHLDGGTKEGGKRLVSVFTARRGIRRTLSNFVTANDASDAVLGTPSLGHVGPESNADALYALMSYANITKANRHSRACLVLGQVVLADPSIIASKAQRTRQQ